MTFQIRTETDADRNNTYQLIETAFKTAKVSDGTEHHLYQKLRDSNAFVPQLSLIAEEKNSLIGHIMLTRFNIKRSALPAIPSLLLAPVSVQLDWRNRRVGTALIEHALKQAETLNFQSIIVLGDPAYYNRFGFRQSTDFGIICMQDIPARYVQVLELVPHALHNIEGKIDFDI